MVLLAEFQKNKNDDTRGFILILIQLLILLLPSVGLYKMFEERVYPAGRLYSFLQYTGDAEAADRKTHWVYWQLIPVAGWFVSIGIFIEFVKTFGKFHLWQHALTAYLAVFYFPYIGFNEKEKFLGPGVVRKHKKSATNGSMPVYLPSLPPH